MILQGEIEMGCDCCNQPAVVDCPTCGAALCHQHMVCPGCDGDPAALYFLEKFETKFERKLPLGAC